MPQDPTAPDPTPVLELLNAFRKSQVMFTAAGLGVFDALAGGPKTTAALATELSADPDALERLLGGCTAVGLLARENGGYANTPAAAAYLTKESPRRMLGYVNYSNAVLWKMWANLGDAIREGTNRWKQTYGWDAPIFSHFFRTEEMKREFLFGMHGFGLMSSPHVVAAVDLSRFTTFVDLGGATGHLAVAACRHYPGLRGVVFDLPEAIPLAREVVGATNVAARVDFAAGDFFTDPLPPGDVYALGRILHDWSEPKILKLLTRIYEALPAGGAVLIAEKLLNDDKSGPDWAVLQSLNMLVCTEGKERTLGEYANLLTQVGFEGVHGYRTPSPLDAVIAVKK
ncbi:class I SAM-dependent methyltransferase [Fimbriiglobus ruber]|uniref:O-methyltransferase, family 2 n=1 Tax=Fimbriiglobus ruber TaxID=1908690 RepID=A0A225DZ50_9BACT|nr:class I SAM-dependent methyltransferase [Fimbriiglobus ruber]OWK41625.1 O-methyltransferase, family 2 [Fimbriiglobus ruber]